MAISAMGTAMIILLLFFYLTLEFIFFFFFSSKCQKSVYYILPNLASPNLFQLTGDFIDVDRIGFKSEARSGQGKRRILSKTVNLSFVCMIFQRL